MKIEVQIGHRYKTRSGEIVLITDSNSPEYASIPLYYGRCGRRGKLMSWGRGGHLDDLWMFESPYDLVEDVTLPAKLDLLIGSVYETRRGERVRIDAREPAPNGDVCYTGILRGRSLFWYDTGRCVRSSSLLQALGVPSPYDLVREVQP